MREVDAEQRRRRAVDDSRSQFDWNELVTRFMGLRGEGRGSVEIGERGRQWF